MRNRWWWFFIPAILAPAAWAAGDITPLQTGSLEQAALTANDPILSGIGWAQRLFGDIVLNPMSMVGQPDGALSEILIMLNLSLMLMGTVWVTYTIVSAGAMTAQEGVFIGKKMHSAWVPLRLVIGAASLTPFFKGLCLAQLVMLWAIQLSIGAGNLAYQKGMEYVTKQNGILSPHIPATDDSTELVNALFQSNICAEGLNAGKLLMHPDGDVPAGELIPSQPKVLDDAVTGKKLVSFESGMRGFTFNMTQCGMYQVNPVQLDAFMRMNSALHVVASEVVTDATKVIVHAEGMDTMPKFDPSVMVDIKKAYVADLKKNAEIIIQQSLSADAERAEMLAGMKQQADDAGFVTAGAWAYTLAKKNSAMLARIAEAPKILKAPISTSDASIESYNNVYSYASNLTGSSMLAANAGSDTGSGEAFIVKKVKEKWCGGSGSFSLGQCITNWMTNDSEGQNVLIRISNAGNNMVWAGMAAEVSARSAERALTATTEDNVAAFLGKKLGGGLIAAPLLGAADAAIEILGYISKTLIMFGLVASTYIPMIFGIVWVYRMVGLCTIWFEGVVGASVWAFSHLDTDGEGLGARANHGYLFVFAVLLNPILMVLGLFAGIGILDVVGGYFMKLYPTMVADVSQDSMVGLLKITSLLIMFVMVNLALVNLCSQLINVIPDQVIAWAGGQFQNVLGRNSMDEVSGKVQGAMSVGSLGSLGAKAGERRYNNQVAAGI